MTQKISPFIEGKYGWEYGESGWNTGADENWLKFSYMFDRNVDDLVSTLPIPAVNGTAYYLTTDKRIYFAVGGVYYSTPTPRWFKFNVRSTGQIYRFDGINISQITSSATVDQNISILQSNVANNTTAISGKASSGTNSDITSLTGLTTPLSVIQGGTGGTTYQALLTNLTNIGAYTKNNLLGVVNQSAGIPTGAVIEAGSNTNGRYIKFADGSQVCFIQSFTLSYINTSNLSGTWAYPVVFATEPAILSTLSGTFSTLTAGVYSSLLRYIQTSTPTASAMFYLSNGNGSATSGMSVSASAIAIGRWY